jgi:N-acetylglucosamine-6-phosphate deacetylase
MKFFDLQVNGYAGVDFNSDDLDLVQMETACACLQRQEVDGILATVITDTIPAMERRLRKIASLYAESSLVSGIVKGIHIEGPFLNPSPGFRGAHPADAIVAAQSEIAERLLEAAGGLTKLVTLAPEGDTAMKTTRLLVDRGIVVSAGHTNASLLELQRAIDAGLSMFTHLGNGCPATLDRHNNIIQRALSLSKQLWICFIADGAHIPFFALKNYLKLIGLGRAVIVTDAISAASLGPGNYTLGRWELSIGDDLVARSADGSHLVGSTVTMQRSFDNLQRYLGLESSQARLLLEKNPCKAIGLAAE